MSVSVAKNTAERNPAHEMAQDTLKQFLTFRLGKEEYGVDIMQVREIKGWIETTRLPNTPEHVRGVINLRGLIVPIFDLHARFGMGLITPTEKNVVIILAVRDRNIGILVDAVSDIVTVNEGEIRPAPMEDDRAEKAYVTGLISLENRMVVLLDMSCLFDKEAAHIQLEEGKVN